MPTTNTFMSLKKRFWAWDVRDQEQKNEWAQLLLTQCSSRIRVSQEVSDGGSEAKSASSYSSCLWCEVRLEWGKMWKQSCEHSPWIHSKKSNSGRPPVGEPVTGREGGEGLVVRWMVLCIVGVPISNCVSFYLYTSQIHSKESSGACKMVKVILKQGHGTSQV